MWSWNVVQGWLVAAMAATLLAALCAAGAYAQDEKRELGIELNKVEDVAGACHGSFVISNKLGYAIERLTLDLYLFDAQGIINQHTVLDIGPVPKTKIRIVTFSLIQEACETVNYMVLNDIPNCTVSAPEPVDCIGLARVWSLGQTGFTQ